jgi:hypothetical protein
MEHSTEAKMDKVQTLERQKGTNIEGRIAWYENGWNTTQKQKDREGANTGATKRWNRTCVSEVNQEFSLAHEPFGIACHNLPHCVLLQQKRRDTFFCRISDRRM